MRFGLDTITISQPEIIVNTVADHIIAKEGGKEDNESHRYKAQNRLNYLFHIPPSGMQLALPWLERLIRYRSHRSQLFYILYTLFIS
jgi:hypothetical protein